MFRNTFPMRDNLLLLQIMTSLGDFMELHDSISNKAFVTAKIFRYEDLTLVGEVPSTTIQIVTIITNLKSVIGGHLVKFIV